MMDADRDDRVPWEMKDWAMRIRGDYVVVEDGQALVAVPSEEDGRKVTYFFADDATVGRAVPKTTRDALSMIGVWADLDWDEVADELDRIRHANPPSPPIGDL